MQGSAPQKGDKGPAGPALPADFSTSSSFTLGGNGDVATIVPVTLTAGGVNPPTAAVPYMRVFLNDGNDDIVLDPSECARVKVPEGTEQTRAVESVDYLRYDDDACTPDDEMDWTQMLAAHGNETISAIKVSEGFAGGTNATAFLSALTVNDKTFAFPG